LLIVHDQHATGLHFVHHTADLPDTVAVKVADVKVEGADTTVAIPPAVITLLRTVARAVVIVAVGSSKHHPVVVVPVVCRMSCERIPGVSAVSGHTQLILISLITDGERRVFCRVPQTAETLDLSTATRHSRMYVRGVMDIAQRISGFRNRLEVALKVFMQKEKLSTSKMKSGAKEDNNEMIIWSFALYAAV